MFVIGKYNKDNLFVLYFPFVYKTKENAEMVLRLTNKMYGDQDLNLMVEQLEIL